MFKVNIKSTLLLTLNIFHTLFSVSIGAFEQISINWIQRTILKVTFIAYTSASLKSVFLVLNILVCNPPFIFI